jgi:hypothetical protein
VTGTVERDLSVAPDDASIRERLVASFRTEAQPRCERLLATLGADDPLSQGQLAEAIADAKLIRGSAAVAELSGIAAAAGHAERILKALYGRRLAWTSSLRETLRAAAADLLDLLEAASPEDGERRARAIASDLARYDAAAKKPQPDLIIPIARLFHSDSGPHILYVPATPQTDFEQQLRALAARGASGGVIRTPPPVTRHDGSRTAAARGRRTPTAPRGTELHALLGESVSRLSATFDGTPETPVPIEQLLYSKQAALERARELARVIRIRGPENSRDLLPELIDLLDLAAAR